MNLLESFSQHLLGLLSLPRAPGSLYCHTKVLLLSFSSSSVPEDISLQSLNQENMDIKEKIKDEHICTVLLISQMKNDTNVILKLYSIAEYMNWQLVSI